MKIQKRLTIVLLTAAPIGAALYGVAVARRPRGPRIVVGPYVFHVVNVSSERMRRLDRRLPEQQVWITVQVEPSDPKLRVRNLHAYLPHLLQNMELIGPDGSRQKPFWRQELSSLSQYDNLQNIVQFSRLQTRFGFDNTAHWKTATLTAHFDSSNWNMTAPEELAVSGKTLRISSITLPE